MADVAKLCSLKRVPEEDFQVVNREWIAPVLGKYNCKMKIELESLTEALALLELRVFKELQRKLENKISHSQSNVAAWRNG